MRRNIGSHTYGDPANSIDKQVRKTSRENNGFIFFAIIVWLEVNGVLVDISEHFHRNLGQTCLGITHCRSHVTID
ncbi:hypothetical protein D3C75_1003080 [compost metagenome]